MANVISGQITVATAGTAVAGPTTGRAVVYCFSAAGGNTGTYVYIGNDGADDVAVTTGIGLGKTDYIYVAVAKNLGQLYFDVATNGDKIDYIRVSEKTPFFAGAI